ncbi:MAG: hypothetical protein IJ412_03995 [Oscillospiraceae bacterium]|nr:hypothetical protein [Oscillospiraceae bacterium]
MKNPGLDRFPLGFWSTLDAQDAGTDAPKDWAEMGMTLTMGHSYTHGVTDKAHFTAMLDSAYENNVRIILCDNRTQARRMMELGEEAYAAELRAVVEDWGTHPAIWGVHMGDEPDAEAYPYYVRALRMIREIAPQWEPYANLLPWWPGMEKRAGTDTWANYLDRFLQDSGMRYLSYDCYTQMNRTPEGTNIYFSNLKLYGDAALRNNVPFWTILLCVPHFKYQDPTLDDIRWQFNTALACGAKGISWFYLYQQNIWNSNYRNAPVNQLGRKTQGYYNISDIQNIFHRTLAPYMDKLQLKKVWHVGQAFGGFDLFTGDDEVELSPGAHPMIMSYFSNPEDDWNYILLVNNDTRTDVNFSLALRGEIAEAQELVRDGQWRSMSGLLFDDGEVTRTETALELPHWYAPGQAILYRYRR